MQEWLPYDSVADTYERVHAPRFAEPARDLVAMAEPPEGGAVLDVGTGTGVAAGFAGEAIGPSGCAVGVDLSEPMMARGTKARPRVAFVEAAGEGLPFRDQSFDAVVGNFVISHVPDYEVTLASLKRVVKLGGKVALSAWSGDEDDLQTTWGEMVRSVVPEEMLEDVWKQASPWHTRFSDRANLEDAFINAGLREVRSEIREYHFVYDLDDYVTGVETWATGRFVRAMLGEREWPEFQRRVRDTFRDRFADPLNDYRSVAFAVGTRDL
jgi:ubiquinone/menaquinone biosynthesis C-methylase UbiE